MNKYEMRTRQMMEELPPEIAVCSSEVSLTQLDIYTHLLKANSIKISNSLKRMLEMEQDREDATCKLDVLKWKYCARVINSLFFSLSIIMAACIYLWLIVRANI